MTSLVSKIYPLISLSHHSYTTSETTDLPFSDYKYLDQGNHAYRFQLLCQRLCNVDTEYFASVAHDERKSFIFQVEIDYNLNLAKFVGLDLSAFPELRKVSPTDLSSLQRQEFASAHRNIERQPEKLVSDCRNTILTDHVDNILFLLVWFSAKIVRVKCCVEFTTYPFLREYCHSMADKRAKSISKLQRDYTKLLTNALAGAYPGVTGVTGANVTLGFAIINMLFSSPLKDDSI